MIGASQIVRAFVRNCPGVRMTNEERDELLRLIHEAQKDAHTEGQSSAQTSALRETP